MQIIYVFFVIVSLEKGWNVTLRKNNRFFIFFYYRSNGQLVHNKNVLIKWQRDSHLICDLRGLAASLDQLLIGVVFDTNLKFDQNNYSICILAAYFYSLNLVNFLLMISDWGQDIKYLIYSDTVKWANLRHLNIGYVLFLSFEFCYTLLVWKRFVGFFGSTNCRRMLPRGSLNKQPTKPVV